jgi:hypothetical protein
MSTFDWRATLLANLQSQPKNGNGFKHIQQLQQKRLVVYRSGH